MSLAYKILGQELISYTQSTVEVPSAGYGYYGENIGGQGTDTSTVQEFFPTTVYTVPAGLEAVVTSIFIANHDTSVSTYDLAVVPAGESLALKHHLRWDMPVAASDFELITTKISLSAGDSIVVYPSTADTVSVTIFGIEK